MEQRKGALNILICYILWGIFPVFWKLLADVNPMYVLAARILWAFLLVGIIVVATGKLPEIKTALAQKKERYLLMAAGICITANWGGYIWAVSNNHIIDSSLAYYMSPILTMGLGGLFFGERLEKYQWLSIGLMVTGVVLAMIGYGTIPYVAILIAVSFTTYGILKKQVKSSPMACLLIETMTVLPFAVAAILYLDGAGAGASGVLMGWRWMLLPLAGAVTTVPLIFFARGIRHVSYSLAGVLMYLNPTLQLLIGVAFYGEAFTQIHLILFLFVWVGILVYFYGQWRYRR